jgi:type IV pilus assembly protein PilB
LGHINEKVLATFLSRQYGITAISLEGLEVPADLIRLVPKSLCERHSLVPLNIENNRLSIAVSDPTNVSAVDDVRFLCNMDVNVYISTESAIQGLIDKAYAGSSDAELNKIIEPGSGADDDNNTGTMELSTEAKAEDIESDNVGEKPVIRLINKLFLEAIKRKVSDIHIEPFESFSRVRFRIDGTLHEVMRTPPQLKVALPARLKVMSQLDISEKRLPQDGRIQVKMKKEKRPLH